MLIRKYIQRELPISPEEILFQGSKIPYWKSIQLFIKQETSIGSQWEGTLESNHQIAVNKEEKYPDYISQTSCFQIMVLILTSTAINRGITWHVSAKHHQLKVNKTQWKSNQEQANSFSKGRSE